MRKRYLGVYVKPLKGTPFWINPKDKFMLQKQTRIDFQIEKQIGSAPAVANLDIYNIKEKAKQIDFRFDLYGTEFGAEIEVYGGYYENYKLDSTLIFKGKVRVSTTSKESPNYITRVMVMNSWFELMKKRVKFEAPENQEYSTTILKAIQLIGGKISDGQKSELKRLLDGQRHEEREAFDTTADDFFNTFAKGQGNRLTIFWEDTGVNFNIPSLTQPTEDPIVISKIHGTPQVQNNGGYNFETDLNGSLRINQPVLLQSETITRTAITRTSSAASLSVDQQKKSIFTPTVVKKIIHAGSNWVGQFKTSAETVTVRSIIDAVKG